MTQITIAALGPGDAGLLTLEALDALQTAERVLLRTGRHGVAALLGERGIPFDTLDALYDAADDFAALAKSAADEVLRMAEGGAVCYGVPDPATDATVEQLIARGASLAILAGVAQEGLVRAQALAAGHFSGGYVCVPAMELKGRALDPGAPLLITELDTRLLAGEVKLSLLGVYPPDTDVLLAGRPIPLHELDRQPGYDHQTAAYVPAVEMARRDRHTFGDLLSIMRRLRRPGDGCPWDMKQTHESLRQYVIEEAYEVVDAINAGDEERIADELGDVLLQVVFHAQIASEHAAFTIDDVLTAICRKMITRHAHIWGDIRCETPEDVLTSWEAIKQKEKGLAKAADTMRDIPEHLPALMRAYKVQNKAKQVGFDWDTPAEALAKVYEEAREVESALASRAGLEEELGDLLFAAANVARLSGIQPELALSRATEKFVRRFGAMEQAILAEGKALSELSLSQMDVYWEAVKQTEEG